MFSVVKNFFILIVLLFFSSCHEKDYDIISEAKKFILNDQNTKKLEKPKNLESKKNKKEYPKIKETNFQKKQEEKKRAGSNKVAIEKKELKNKSKTSRVLEDLKSQKEKENSIEIQKQTKKIEKNDDKYLDKIKVGVMLPLSGEHSEIGNLILNAIEMAVFQTEENKLEFHIKDTQGKSDIAKSIF